MRSGLINVFPDFNGLVVFERTRRNNVLGGMAGNAKYNI